MNGEQEPRFQIGDRVRFYPSAGEGAKTGLIAIIETVERNRYGEIAYWVKDHRQGRHFRRQEHLAALILN